MDTKVPHTHSLISGTEFALLNPNPRACMYPHILVFGRPFLARYSNMSAQAEAIGADGVFCHGENKETRKTSSKPYLEFGGVKTVRTSGANASSRHCAKGKKRVLTLKALILVPGRTLQYSGRVRLQQEDRCAVFLRLITWGGIIRMHHVSSMCSSSHTRCAIEVLTGFRVQGRIFTRMSTARVAEARLFWADFMSPSMQNW